MYSRRQSPRKLQLRNPHQNLPLNLRRIIIYIQHNLSIIKKGIQQAAQPSPRHGLFRGGSRDNLPQQFAGLTHFVWRIRLCANARRYLKKHA
jgi:hypothetical protein